MTSALESHMSVAAQLDGKGLYGRSMLVIVRATMAAGTYLCLTSAVVRLSH